jgi:isoquinoline 1-oxidoreductase beta subunit
MLNAAIKDCPVFGGKLKSFNAAAIEKRPGVKKVVRWATARWPWWPTPGGAPRSAGRLPIEWDEGPHAKASSESSPRC